MALSPSATSPAAAPGRVRALRWALVATALLAAASWGAIQTSTWRTALSAGRELRVQQLCGDIAYFDELLTMSATLAAVTGERRWRERYDAHVNPLDATLRELRALSPDLFEQELGVEADLANQRLVAREARVFELVDQDQLQAARAVLESREYLADKRDYAAGIARAQKALAYWVATDRDRTRQLGAMFSAVSTLLAALAVFAWSVVRRHTAAMAASAELASARAQSAAAAAADRHKSLFVANISHELRTPLTAILGYAELLQEDHGNPPPALAAAQTIQRQGEHLLQIVNDLLDMSKIEAGKVVLHFEPTDVAQIVEDVLSALRVRARGKGIGLERSFRTLVPRTLRCDPVRLRQILVNLIGNAVKFTGAGQVQVLVDFAAAAAGNTLRIAVVDSGIGMSAEQCSRLFRPFEQADESTERRFGGTGLGLTIARYYARLLGGDIEVTSAVGTGSTFTLHLPVAEAAAELWQPGDASLVAACPTAKLPAIEPSTLAGVRILLAEDGVDNQRLLGQVLRRAGAELTVVGDGAKALQALLGPAPPFDVVLLDMHMPQADGYQVARSVRAAGRTLPIVALTASAMPGDRELCLNAGCSDYLTKPIDRRQLLRTCAHWVRGPAAGRDG